MLMIDSCPNLRFYKPDLNPGYTHEEEFDDRGRLGSSGHPRRSFGVLSRTIRCVCCEGVRSDKIIFMIALRSLRIVVSLNDQGVC